MNDADVAALVIMCSTITLVCMFVAAYELEWLPITRTWRTANCHRMPRIWPWTPDGKKIECMRCHNVYRLETRQIDALGAPFVKGWKRTDTS